MPIIVQKYGGSSVADVSKIRGVAERVKTKRDQGFQMVVVVSAMGKTTDQLLALAKDVSPEPPRRELDMLLTCGERISMALLSMALQELGVPAISFTGSQSGIITNDAHAQARIVEVRPYRIQDELAQGKVVIVAGYQGVSYKREVTTLGRGGSDTTAVALAAALDAEACEIYSDVDGVFSADPRVVPDARKLTELSYEEMQELAHAGAKVLNAQAVEFARARGIVILAKSTFGGGTGTVIHAPRSEGAAGVKAVTCDDQLAVLSARSQDLNVGELLEFLEARGAFGRIMTWDGLGPNGVAFVALPLQDLHSHSTLKRDLDVRFGAQVQLLDSLATVTCVGNGINREWQQLRRAMEIASELNVDVKAVHASPLQLSLLVERARAKELTARLHQELLGDSPQRR